MFLRDDFTTGTEGKEPTEEVGGPGVDFTTSTEGKEPTEEVGGPGGDFTTGIEGLKPTGEVGGPGGDFTTGTEGLKPTEDVGGPGDDFTTGNERLMPGRKPKKTNLSLIRCLQSKHLCCPLQASPTSPPTTMPAHHPPLVHSLVIISEP